MCCSIHSSNPRHPPSQLPFGFICCLSVRQAVVSAGRIEPHLLHLPGAIASVLDGEAGEGAAAGLHSGGRSCRRRSATSLHLCRPRRGQYLTPTILIHAPPLSAAGHAAASCMLQNWLRSRQQACECATGRSTGHVAESARALHATSKQGADPGACTAASFGRLPRWHSAPAAAAADHALLSHYQT